MVGKKMMNMIKMIPEEIPRFLLTLVIIMMINFVFFSTCNYFDCYQVNFMNLFRTNLICNGCTSLTYHIMNYQMGIYLGLGVYFTSSLKKIFDDITSKIL
jgi:hypothetical protein